MASQTRYCVIEGDKYEFIKWGLFSNTIKIKNETKILSTTKALVMNFHTRAILVADPLEKNIVML
jgi:hypothetical protein